MKLRTKEEVQAYYKGKKDGIWAYTHWKDGRQYVGTTGTLLSEAVGEVMEAEKHDYQLLSEGEDVYV